MKFDHNNISPLDRRYAKKISNFRENFSESELIKIRFEIEIECILFLCSKLPNTFKPLSKKSVEKIVKFKNAFDNKSVLQINGCREDEGEISCESRKSAAFSP